MRFILPIIVLAGLVVLFAFNLNRDPTLVRTDGSASFGEQVNTQGGYTMFEGLIAVDRSTLMPAQGANWCRNRSC